MTYYEILFLTDGSVKIYNNVRTVMNSSQMCECVQASEYEAGQELSQPSLDK